MLFDKTYLTAQPLGRRGGVSLFFGAKHQKITKPSLFPQAEQLQTYSIFVMKYDQPGK
jgi:hypothetical protein